MSKVKWSVLRVHREYPEFLFGKHRMHRLPSDCLNQEAQIVVLRDGVRLDQEWTKARTSSGVGVHITGLGKIILASRRTPKKRSGVLDELLPEWFQPRDVIRVSMDAAVLLGWLRTFRVVSRP